jgi:hypothetical protein
MSNVAQMERSGIRDFPFSPRAFLDYAPLHPGYSLFQKPPHRTRKSHETQQKSRGDRRTIETQLLIVFQRHFFIQLLGLGLSHLSQRSASGHT